MPRDFMCSRITDNSPIRFLDCDMSDKINLYRPKIPYVLQTLFENGEWRSQRVNQTNSDGRVLRGKIKNPTQSNHYESWKGDWNNFVKSNQMLDLLTAYWNYGETNGRPVSTILANGIACPPPKLKICIGDREIETSITTPIRMGVKGNKQSFNYTRQIVRAQSTELERKLDKSKYQHLLIQGEYTLGKKTPYRMLRYKYDVIHKEQRNQSYMSGDTRKRWENHHIKYIFICMLKSNFFLYNTRKYCYIAYPPRNEMELK